MEYYIRADASITIGTGHVMRCLTLAQQLAGQGGRITFVFRDMPGNLGELIKQQGFGTHTLPADLSAEEDARAVASLLAGQSAIPDWLIVDHYGIDAKWEQVVRPYARSIMVIDDMANRVHDCDVLLDQNYLADMQSRYNGLVSDRCIKFLGPQHALLRPEFIAAREIAVVRDGMVRRILVFFGGSDPTGETVKAIQAINNIGHMGIQVDVVVGKSNPEKERIQEVCAGLKGFDFHCQINNMAELMVRADLAIGAGGTATWERCCVGLPTIAIITADNQEKIVENLAEIGVLINMGRYSEVAIARIRAIVFQIINDRNQLIELSRNAYSLMSKKEETLDLLSLLLEDYHV